MHRFRFQRKLSLAMFFLLSAVVAEGCAGPELGDVLQDSDESEVATSQQPLLGAARMGWAEVTSTGSLSRAKRWSTSGGTITSSRTSTGNYTVDFAGLGGSGGNVQVVAAGASNERCKVLDWAQVSSVERVRVVCHTPSGSPVNAGFVVWYSSISTHANAAFAGAFLVANQPAAADYTPSSSFSSNSTGGIPQIVRTGNGAYNVRLPGVGVSGGSVQITAQGSDANHCKVLSFGPMASMEIIDVRCFNGVGAPADTVFSLNFMKRGSQFTNDVGASTFANNPASASYAPMSLYSYIGTSDCAINGPAPANAATRQGTGQYSMTHSYQGSLSSGDGVVAHVVAYGGDTANYCKLYVFSQNGNTGLASVQTRCYTAAGAFVDSQYLEVFGNSLWRQPC